MCYKEDIKGTPGVGDGGFSHLLEGLLRHSNIAYAKGCDGRITRRIKIAYNTE